MLRPCGSWPAAVCRQGPGRGAARACGTACGIGAGTLLRRRRAGLKRHRPRPWRSRAV